MTAARWLLAALALAPPLAPAATFTIINLDQPGEGLNDPTVFDEATPDGFPPGTSRGDKRLAVVLAAADEWTSKLQSNVDIRIAVSFDPLDCSASEVVLGKAGPTAAAHDFANAPKPNTDYAIATAEAIANQVLLPPSQVHIVARFNSAVDNNCFGGGRWWYGTTALPSTPYSFVELYPVVLHEFAHGLGFLSFACINATSGGAPAACGATPAGGYASGRVDAWSHRQRDLSTGLTWNQLTDAQRATSITNSYGLVWDGPSVNLGLNLWAPTAQGIHGGYLGLWAPTWVDPGSSVSHWTVPTSPFLLMGPFLNERIVGQTDLTDCVLRDIGWTVTTSNCSLGVNQPPTISAPATIHVTEATGLQPLRGIRIVDPDSGGANVRVGLALDDNRLGFGSDWLVGGSGGDIGVFTLTGTVEAINNALAAGNLYWRTLDPDASGTNALQITVDDLGHHGSGGPRTATKTVTIVIDPVNDAPRFSNASYVIGEVHEGYSRSLGVGTLIDDSGPNPIRLTATGTCGGLLATSGDGVTVSGTGYERVLEGTVSDLSAYVAASKLAFFAGDDADAYCYITLTLEDFGHTGAGGPLTAAKEFRYGIYRWNDPPAISAPDTHDFYAGGSKSIRGIVLSDPDARDGRVRFTVEVDGGWLIAGVHSAVTVNGSNSNRMTMEGTIAGINAFIASGNLVYYMPVPTIRSANATLRIDDQGHTGQPGFLVATKPLALFAYTIFVSNFE